MRIRRVAVAIIALALGSCGSDSSAGGAGSSTASTITSTVPEAAVAEPVTTAPRSTQPIATEVVATTPTCEVTGDTNVKTSGEPLTLSPLAGTDIQVDATPCVEEITIRFASATSPGEFPGWSVEYVDDPVYLGESGAMVDIAGDATLLVRLGAWMPSMEGEGYAGPTDIVPPGAAHIVEMRQTSNFEGVTNWAIGLDATYPFTVTVPDGPPRLVIRLQVAG